MIGMQGRFFIVFFENVVTGMAGLTTGPAGLGIKPVEIFLVMTVAAIDRSQAPGVFMTFIPYSRVAIQAGDFITVNRRFERLDVNVAAACSTARFMAINTLFPGICPEFIGRKYDHQTDQVKPNVLLAAQWMISHLLPLHGTCQFISFRISASSAL